MCLEALSYQICRQYLCNFCPEVLPRPIWPIFLVDRLNWQCCLAGSSKTRILIFAMAMGADYSLQLIFNETCGPQFNGLNNSFLASVYLFLVCFLNFESASEYDII